MYSSHRVLESSAFRPQAPEAEYLGIEEQHKTTVVAQELYHPWSSARSGSP